MKRLLQLLIFSSNLLPQLSAAQATEKDFKVEFAASESVMTRERDKSTILQFNLKAEDLDPDSSYRITVQKDKHQTSLSDVDFSLDAGPFAVSGEASKSFPFYVTIHGDSLPDRERKLVLDVLVERGSKNLDKFNTGAQKAMSLTVKPSLPSLTDYRYLAYVGTNFDLVDGAKPKNLFFATNVYLPNANAKLGATGIFASVYGNRTVSTIDSSDNVRRIARIDRLSDSTATFYYQNATRTSLYASDNIGAYVSPLINLGSWSSKSSELHFMFAPSLEVVWRRISNTTSFSNITDSDTLVRDGSFLSLENAPTEYTINRSQWDFNYGIGAFVTHETRDISMRLYFAYGLSTLYFPTTTSSNPTNPTSYVQKPASFFSARFWITESVSGLTLQAEYSNIISDPRPYFGATLSKALSFKNLGSVFKPITR